MTTPKRDTRLLLIVFGSLFFILTLTYTNRLAHKAELDLEITRWEERIERSQTNQRALATELRYVQSAAYVEKLAHDEFSMAKEGETLVAVVPIEQAVDENAVEEMTTASNSRWQRWLTLLGLR